MVNLCVDSTGHCMLKLSIISGHALDKISIWIGELSDIDCLRQSRPYPINWKPEREQKPKEGNLPLFNSCLITWGDTLIFFCPWFFRPELNYTIGFPGCLACRWPILGLLSLHSYVSKFLMISLFLYIQPICSVYLENANTQNLVNLFLKILCLCSIAIAL